MTKHAEIESLKAVAVSACQQAHAPYSRYRVGAAVSVGSGKVYAGCNIENASYGGAVCAERVAMWKAWSEGEREFKTLVVVADGKRTPVPCGLCRQVLWELSKQLEIVVFDVDGNAKNFQIYDLIPDAF